MTRYQHVLSFWFGDPLVASEVLGERYKVWFGSDAAFDAEVRDKFGADLYRAGAGELDAWGDTPKGRLALIVLLDQFPRNIFRGTPQAFAYDARALDVCVTGIAAGDDRRLGTTERTFFYLPLEHAEDPPTQAHCVEMFAALQNECDDAERAFVAKNYQYALDHYRVIEQFGRFPHRNAILGRQSSAEELRYLADSAPSFGQK